MPEGFGAMILSGDGKSVFKLKGMPDKLGTFNVRAGKNPKEIDVTEAMDKAKQVLPGIYKIEGDTLTIAYPAEGPSGKRPTAFDSGDILLMTLKRQKP